MAYCYEGLQENCVEDLHETYHINFSKDKFDHELKVKEHCVDFLHNQYPRRDDLHSRIRSIYDIKVGIRITSHFDDPEKRFEFYCRVCGKNHGYYCSDASDCRHTSYCDDKASYSDTRQAVEYRKKERQRKYEEECSRQNEQLRINQARWENDQDLKEAELFARIRP